MSYKMDLPDFSKVVVVNDDRFIVYAQLVRLHLIHFQNFTMDQKNMEAFVGRVYDTLDRIHGSDYLYGIDREKRADESSIHRMSYDDTFLCILERFNLDSPYDWSNVKYGYLAMDAYYPKRPKVFPLLNSTNMQAFFNHPETITGNPQWLEIIPSVFEGTAFVDG